MGSSKSTIILAVCFAVLTIALLLLSLQPQQVGVRNEGANNMANERNEAVVMQSDVMTEAPILPKPSIHEHVVASCPAPMSSEEDPENCPTEENYLRMWAELRRRRRSNVSSA
eukprot:PhM_4_TR13996/c1_g2_i1/m.55928